MVASRQPEDPSPGTSTRW